MFYRRRLITFGGLFILVMAVDGLKFLFLGGPNIINWYSFIHPVWVATAVTLLFLGAWLDRLIMWQTLFWLYFAVAISALINQYVPFWSALTYNCMLFNLVFVTLYFFLSIPRPKSEP